MKDTKNRILKATTSLFAQEGLTGCSMRKLAQEVGVAPSVIYHYFPDQTTLHTSMFRSVSVQLGRARKQLVEPGTTADRLKQRIQFQFEHIDEVVAVLKFYLSYRHLFPKLQSGGFIPVKAYQHIEEVLTDGVKNQELIISDIPKTAKVITHAINGFLLEYYPHQVGRTEAKDLVNEIHWFIMRAITRDNSSHING